MVRPLKAVEDEPLMVWAVVPVKATVPVVVLTIPLFDQFPFIFTEKLPAKVNQAPLFIVTLPFTVRVVPVLVQVLEVMSVPPLVKVRLL